MQEPKDLEQPRRIVGRYELYDELAAGGMATVHVGRLLGPAGFSRTVAIKRLHPQYAKDPEFVAMFFDEARLAARIQHPNVVATVDVVSADQELFLVMDYIRGESFSRLLRSCREKDLDVPIEIIVSVLSGVLHGLHAAHEATDEHGEPLTIVHRDVSPQNVMVGVDGVSRVLDFGVAKAAARVQVTRNGQMNGKLCYMAPEQLTGQAVDRRADVFAAGIMLWEAVTGRKLFDASDAEDAVSEVLNAEIPRPTSIVESLPPVVDDLVLCALARDARERFQTAREFAIALEESLPMASLRSVGDWVQGLSADVLRSREKVVAEMEKDAAHAAERDESLPAFPGTLQGVGPDSAPSVSSDGRASDDPTQTYRAGPESRGSTRVHVTSSSPRQAPTSRPPPKPAIRSHGSAALAIADPPRPGHAPRPNTTGPRSFPPPELKPAPPKPPPIVFDDDPEDNEDTTIFRPNAAAILRAEPPVVVAKDAAQVTLAAELPPPDFEDSDEPTTLHASSAKMPRSGTLRASAPPKPRKRRRNTYPTPPPAAGRPPSLSAITPLPALLPAESVPAVEDESGGVRDSIVELATNKPLDVVVRVGPSRHRFVAVGVVVAVVAFGGAFWTGRMRSRAVEHDPAAQAEPTSNVAPPLRPPTPTSIVAHPTAPRAEPREGAGVREQAPNESSESSIEGAPAKGAEPSAAKPKVHARRTKPKVIVAKPAKIPQAQEDAPARSDEPASDSSAAPPPTIDVPLDKESKPDVRELLEINPYGAQLRGSDSKEESPSAIEPAK